MIRQRRRVVEAPLLLLVWRVPGPTIAAAPQEQGPRAVGGRGGHRGGDHEERGPGDADGARHQQARHRPVDQVPEDRVDEAERDRDLEGRVPGEFALGEGEKKKAG